MAKKTTNNRTSASGYKAGGGSQAKSAKSSNTKGMSPAEIALLAASFIPAGRVAGTGAKAGIAVGKAIASAVRGRRTYYHGSPNEIPVGSTLKTRSTTGGASASRSKKIAEGYSKTRLTLTSDGVKKASGNVYKVKSKSGKVSPSKKQYKEVRSNDFVVIKKVTKK